MTARPRLGIQARLFLIQGLAAVTVISAGAVALLALDDIQNEVEILTQRDLPAATAALDLARVVQRLQTQGASLMAAATPEDRAAQQQRIKADALALRRARDPLQAQPAPPGADRLEPLAAALDTVLSELGRTLDQEGALADALDQERQRVLATQERLRQILGPSILAVAAITDRPTPGDLAVYRAAVQAQAPLLSAERLIDAAVAQVLLAANADTPQALANAQEAHARAWGALPALVATLPAGLRPGVLEALGQDPLVFTLRRQALDAAARRRALVHQTQTVSQALKSLGDHLALETTDTMGSVTAHLSQTIHTNALALMLACLALLLLASVVSFFAVVRPVGRGLAGVTNAMSRLAAGERDARVPALERADEIGDLARAFQVFKDQVFRLEVMDRELTEKSHLLVATFDTMNDGFSVCDAEGRLVAWNPRYPELYGLERERLKVGLPLADILEELETRGAQALTPDGRPLGIPPLAQGRTTASRRCELHLENGAVVELRSNPMPRGGFVTIHTDVTEQRATERSLRQAQKMELVGQLTGGIAHDFNNILTVILGNLDILEHALDGPLRERALKARGAAQRAARQVERLMGFARRQTLVPESVAVNALVAAVHDLLGEGLGPGLVLDTDLAPDLPRVWVDPGQLENALVNLIVNARDALGQAPPGVGNSRICLATRPDPTGVALIVSDTGPGMTPEVLERALEPFFTTKPPGKGTGLGLCMVYGFVTQSGGRLLLDSRLGQGTTVTLLLPAEDLPDEATEEIPSADPQALVLVVDDDLEVLEITVGQLRDLGYPVIAASDGPSALALLHTTPEVRLMVSDLAMPPPLDGPALALRVRAIRPDVAIVFTSAHPAGLAPPGAEVLAKPVAPARLARALAQVKP